MTLTATDRRGRFVRNLTPADLIIRDNGEPVERITYFQRNSDLALRVALVIDTSDSILGFFREEQHSAKTFLKHILRPASDLALIVGFNQMPRIEQTLTADQDQLWRTIRNLRTGGNTAVYDAVALASRELSKDTDNMVLCRVIILITDGEDNSSRLTLEQVGDIAKQNESIIYVLNTNPFPEETADRAMKWLSEITGGRVLLAHGDEEITRAFLNLETELRSQYAVGYKPAKTQPDGSFHTISILTPKKVRARYRQGYFAR